MTMTSKTRDARAAVAAVVLAVAFLACKAGGPEAPFKVLDGEATALRDQFNKDIGKTRVVMLVAPT
jgi:hypothetical protein